MKKKTSEALHFSGSGSSVPLDADESLHYPIDFFRYYFTSEIIAEIARQSALYSMQAKPQKPWKVTHNDVEKFIGICLYMSVHVISSTHFHPKLLVD